MNIQTYIQAIKDMTHLPDEMISHLIQIVEKVTDDQRQRIIDKLTIHSDDITKAGIELEAFYAQRNIELTQLEKEFTIAEEQDDRNQEATRLTTLFN